MFLAHNFIQNECAASPKRDIVHPIMFSYISIVTCSAAVSTSGGCSQISGLNKTSMSGKFQVCITSSKCSQITGLYKTSVLGKVHVCITSSGYSLIK